jgi:metal-dependent amidase/aminoacylase/carboxypeptidase family protein
VVNDAGEVRRVIGAASAVLGAEQVRADFEPVMGSEDFAFMLEGRPGAYVFLGQADGAGGAMIHNSHYDFNDRLLPIGVSYWIRLVEQILANEAHAGR